MERSTLPTPPVSRPPGSALARVHTRLRHSYGGLPRTFWLLCLGMLVNRAGSFVIVFLSIYLTQARGYSVATAGVVVALYGAGAMTASVLGGYLADHAGRRVTMLAALSLGGAGMMALGFARDLRVIAPATFVVALLGEAYRPAMQAAVADLVPPADRVRAFGMLYWVINIGFSIGALVGGALASASFTLLFLFDGLTSLLFALLIALAVPETRPPWPATSETSGHPLRDFLAPYRDGPFGWFVALSVLILLVFMQALSALPLDMAARVPRAWIGAVLSINGIAIVLVQPFLAPTLQRRDRSRMLAIGATLVGAGFGLNALARGPWLYAAGMLVLTIGEIFVLPIANAVVGDVAPTPMRGRYQGAYGLSFGLAGFGAPLAGTFVMQHFGAGALWIGCFTVGLAVAAGHLFLAPSLRRLREQRLAVRPGT